MLDALVERCPVTGARAVVHLKGLAGNREPLPEKWVDPELFAALARECKKLLKVIWD